MPGLLLHAWDTKIEKRQSLSSKNSQVLGVNRQYTLPYYYGGIKTVMNKMI